MTDVEVGARLRLPVRVVQELALSGELPGFKLGNRWRFRPAAIDKWERQRERETAS